MMIIEIPLAVIFTIIIAKMCKIEIQKIKITKKIIIVLGVIILLFSKEIFVILEDVISSFQVKSTINNLGIVDNGGNIRMEQFQDLIQTWLQKPIFGWGDGANALNIVRSETSGMYELNYIALLMQRGIIGISIYIIQIGWVIKQLFKIGKRRDENVNFTIAMLIGYISIMLANATNPYISSFDGTIFIILPLLIINMYLKRSEEENSDERNYFSRWKWNKVISSNKSNVKADGANI